MSPVFVTTPFAFLRHSRILTANIVPALVSDAIQAPIVWFNNCNIPPL